MSSTSVGNALFEPILQCISRYTATRLVLDCVFIRFFCTPTFFSSAIRYYVVLLITSVVLVEQ